MACLAGPVDVQEQLNMHEKLFPDVIGKSLSEKSEQVCALTHLLVRLVADAPCYLSQEVAALQEFLKACEGKLTTLTIAAASMAAHAAGAAAGSHGIPSFNVLIIV
jgi:hypothetical protein